jgi:predicted DNA binding CopG/RHH family protein
MSAKSANNTMGEPGTRFGPLPHHYDPYDQMSNEELEAALGDVLRRETSVTISIRIPAALLERTKRLAAAGGVPYQALIKRLVDAGVSRLEERAKH